MDKQEKLLQESTFQHNEKFGQDLEPRRWGILLAFCLYYMSSAIGWLTYNSTSIPSMAYFNIDNDQLLFFTDVNLYICFALSYAACWVAYKYFSVSMIACAGATALGGWIRYIVGPNYAVVLACQVILGIAATPLFGYATLLPDRWFSTKERFTVTTISIFANYIGWALGCILPCALIGDDPNKMPTNSLVQAIFFTVAFLACAIFVRDRPRVPPSYSASVKQTNQLGFWKEMKVMVKIPQFVACSIYFGVVLGISNSISTTNGIYMENLNLSYLVQGFITGSYVLAGLITGLAGTFWIEQKGVLNYDFMIKIFISLSFFTLVALGILFCFVEDPSTLLIFLCNCAMGVGLIGFMPFVTCSIIETTFPIPESMSTNGMSMISQIASVAASHLSTANFVGKGGYLVLAAFMLPCWVYSMFWYKTDYRKQRADEAHQQVGEGVQDSIYLIDAKKKISDSETNRYTD